VTPGLGLFRCTRVAYNAARGNGASHFRDRQGRRRQDDVAAALGQRAAVLGHRTLVIERQATATLHGCSAIASWTDRRAV